MTDMEERRSLIRDRIQRIPEEMTGTDGISCYFRETAAYILKTFEILEVSLSGKLWEQDLDRLKTWNALWEEATEAGYDKSFLNPKTAYARLPEASAQLLCFLRSELHMLLPYAYEHKETEFTILTELYVEIYLILNRAEGADVPEAKRTIAAYFHDYADLFMEQDLKGLLDPKQDFFTKIVDEADLSDDRYLYFYGSPIGENELKIASFLRSLPQEEIDAMAHTMTEAYRLGFQNMNKDLSRKKIVSVEYHIGFERMIRSVLKGFREMGLEPTVKRQALSSFLGFGGEPRYCYTSSLSRQYQFDHKNDKALYLDKAFTERRLECLKHALETMKGAAADFGGPAVMETFGEEIYAPVFLPEALSYDKKQDQLNVSYAVRAGNIRNQYIPGSETGFTIIAYPLPSIGEKFEEIFRETIRINTLDYKTYQTIQQKMIDVLDQACCVRVQGAGANRTDLTVQLYPLQDPAKETCFENCVADVNVPVGEVFTSPVLKGTEGTLHVSRVYLEGLAYEGLEIKFKDGIIIDYSCKNYDNEEENKKYIYENILFRHPTLPMGEFAIGTNTTAYVMGRRFGIEQQLPVLIAEKTGPHFAVGDTCYSHEEDEVSYNPDGKRIVARSNEYADKRETEPEKAYFQCHTDITIPYDELKRITAVTSDGRETDLIRDGRFVLPGTEALNEPLDAMDKES